METFPQTIHDLNPTFDSKVTMHFSTTFFLTSLFSFSIALPADLPPAVKGLTPFRLDVSYDWKTFSSFATYSGGGKSTLSPVKASAPFTIKAYNSESPIHMMDITASYNKFFVGNATGSFCPKAIPNCPRGNVTALEVTNTGGAHMDVGIPGGQAVYIGPQGQLRFSQARVPVGRDATMIEFALSVNPIPAPPGVSAFVFSGVGKASGYLACPVTPKGPWQVFADLASIQDSWVPGGDVSNCIGFDALAADYTSPAPAAYEYM
ncbi:MAG: hypothetical protein Q9170_008316 [Blastenia crenularia]